MYLHMRIFLEVKDDWLKQQDLWFVCDEGTLIRSPPPPPPRFYVGDHTSPPSATAALLAGAVSRSIAHTAVHPAIIVKTLLQGRGTAAQLNNLSFKLLTRGSGAQFFMSLPHGAFNYATLEVYNSTIHVHFVLWSPCPGRTRRCCCGVGGVEGVVSATAVGGGWTVCLGVFGCVMSALVAVVSPFRRYIYTCLSKI